MLTILLCWFFVQAVIVQLLYHTLFVSYFTEFVLALFVTSQKLKKKLFVNYLLYPFWF